MTNIKIIACSFLAATAVFLFPSCEEIKELLENQPPTACFTMNISSGLYPLTVTFDASCSEDPEGRTMTFTWEFGDGETGAGLTIAHTFTIPGTYTVRLTVTDDEGQTHTAADTVEVKRVKWIYAAGESIYYSTPAIGDDGTIYFATGIYMNTEYGRLYALNAEGTLKWVRDLDENGYSPSIGIYGNIYVQDATGALYKFSKNGTLLWKHDTNVRFADVGTRTPAIGMTGVIYFGGFCIEAVYPSGITKWKNESAAIVTASPVIGPDGHVLVVTGMGTETLYKIDKNDGDIIWESTIEFSGEHFNAFSAPAIDTTGMIYFGAEVSHPNYGGYVYAVRPNGMLKWRYFVDGYIIRSSPTIGPSGYIYVGTKVGFDHKSKLISLNPNGTLRWEYEVESIHTWDDIYCTPTIGYDGTIYFGAETGYLYAIDQDGNYLWEQELQWGNNWSSPAIKSDGTLYIGTISSEWTGNLYAVKTESLGLALSVWPKFQHDNKNTGRY